MQEKAYSTWYCWVLGAPEHLQVARHRARRLHDRRVRPDGLVQRAQHLGLRGQRLAVRDAVVKSL
jgi:hypothetical protein